MARTMLLCSSLPHNFWAEVISTTCYVHNRALIRPIIRTTPYELLRGRKPNISHLRCFGNKCFIHNNGKNRLSKFDPRSDEAVSVGYANHSKAYKVFNKRTLCIEESVHVIFDENNTFDKAERDEEEVMNEPDFCLYKGDIPKLDEEDKEIKGTNDKHGNPSNEKGKRSEGERFLDLNHLKKVSPVQITFMRLESLRNGDIKTLIPWSLVNLRRGVQTRRRLNNFSSFYSFLSTIEPTNSKEVLAESDWIVAMQEELQQFKRNKVWHLVPRPRDRSVIRTR
ncbi:uncharacterized protein LOC141640280 [Silene latifolia]|uniref:uncharacterized protein LOC141640280 n=1 Tax=Silene latifolia TaxID=37657 RepID=UPI003D7778A7